ncbi:MAG: hypothetical protein WC842_04345 [Candidatus Paceibacterota bacterium]|jgi:hypothetical protein
MKLQKLINLSKFGYVSEKITESNFPVQKEDKKKVSFDLFPFVFFSLCMIALYKVNFNLFSFCVLLLSWFGVIFVFLRDNRKEYQLFHFEKIISSEDVIKEMNKIRFRPATLREMLRWAIKNWDRKSWVIALGQTWFDHGDCHRYVAVLNCYGNRRLSPYGLNISWSVLSNFLAVKK